MEQFDLKKFLVENKLTTNSKVLNELSQPKDLLGPKWDYAVKDFFGGEMPEDIRVSHAYYPSAPTTRDGSGHNPGLYVRYTASGNGRYLVMSVGITPDRQDHQREAQLTFDIKHPDMKPGQISPSLLNPFREEAYKLLSNANSSPQNLAKVQSQGTGRDVQEGDIKYLDDNLIKKIKSIPAKPER